MTNPAHTIHLDSDFDAGLLRPIADYVVLEELRREKTNGGLYLPKNTATDLVLCRVVSVGNGIFNDRRNEFFPIELSAGEHVLIEDYSGERLEQSGAKHRIVHSRWIPAKVEPKTGDAWDYDFAALEPRMDYVLLDPQDETKVGRLYLADGMKDAPYRRARVVRVGPGVWDSTTGRRIPKCLTPGQQVAFVRYAGTEVTVGGKLMRLVQEADIICVVEGMK